MSSSKHALNKKKKCFWHLYAQEECAQSLCIFLLCLKKGEVPCRVYTMKEWQSFFDNNRIRQQKRSRSTMECHETNVSNRWPRVMAVGTVQQYVDRCDKQVCALFHSDDPESMLRDCIVQLKDAEVNVEKLAQLVNQSELSPLSTQQLFSVQQKVLYLCHAYQLALLDMPCHETWQACCSRAISMLANADITTISNECTLH